jgi:hypothetical protein
MVEDVVDGLGLGDDSDKFEAAVAAWAGERVNVVDTFEERRPF